MSAAAFTPRCLVANAGTVLAAAALASLDPTLPTTFDPVAFLADLKAARCRVHLMRPATVFWPGDDRPSYFILWPPRTGAFDGYRAVMAKRHGAVEACPDNADLVAARLVELNRWAS